MKTGTVLATLAFLAASQFVQADSGCASFVYEETLRIGGEEADVVKDLAVDPDGNILLVGHFTGTIDFDPGEGVDEHTGTGDGDVFVTKLGPDGSYQWTQVFGGPGWNTAYGVAISPTGSIVVTGTFDDTVDFDPTEAVDERTPNGLLDVFITKLTSDGSYSWTRTFGGFGFDFGKAAAIGVSGNIFVIGTFAGPIDFDPGVGEDVQTLGHGVFITAYTAQGEYRWTGSFGGDFLSSIDNSGGLGVDADGDVLAVGTWGNSGTPPGATMDFDPSEGVDERSAPGGGDVWVSKWHGDGSYAWTRIIGGAAWESGSDLAVDAEGSVWLTGYFNGDPHDDPSVDFDPTLGVDYHTSNGDSDFFITKLTGDGQYLWTRTDGGADDDGGTEIGVDSGGNLFMIGWFGHYGETEPGYPVDFDPDDCVDIQTSNGKRDIFVTRYEANGDYGWTYTLGSPDGWDTPIAIAAGINGTIWSSGTFETAIDFDPSDEVDEYTPVGHRDSYLTRLSCSAAGCAGDVNVDDNINPLDLGFVLSHFGCTVAQGDPDCAAADANCDGLVDPLDSGYVAARFGECP